MVSAGLDMLEESLQKKIIILKKIEEQNEKQRDILKSPKEVDEAAFDRTIEAKGELIEQIIAIDDGFQSLFDKVKGEVDANKTLYSDQIRRMQGLIQEVTGLSASIEASEHRNKMLAEKYFSSAREQMTQSKHSSSAAFNYYQTMNNFKNIPPQFMDTKH